VSTTERVLLGAAAFSLAVSGIYWFMSYEPAGSLMLLTMAVGLFVAAVYMALLRRHSAVTGDRQEADPAGAAGEPIGVFASHSSWPVILALGSAVGLTGLIYGWWLALVGAIGVTAALVGLMREDRSAPPSGTGRL
jgi:hypothetical protein